MKNLGQMLKQAQAMQSKMAEMQEKLAAMEMTGASGGGMVKVTLNGKNEVRSVKIDPSLVDPKETEMLEDLVVAAFNDAKTKVDANMAEEMAKITGGLQLPPGVKLPF
jgi:DNA-binding YbaB/EbfC family protein